MLFLGLQSSMTRTLFIRVGNPFFMVIDGLFPADIKPNNFFVDWKAKNNGFVIERVQLGDLEDAAYIPPGSAMVGKQAGNSMWRSPEAHAKGPVSKPTDIFSFALVGSLPNNQVSASSDLITHVIVHLRSAQTRYLRCREG